MGTPCPGGVATNRINGRPARTARPFSNWAAIKQLGAARLSGPEGWQDQEGGRTRRVASLPDPTKPAHQTGRPRVSRYRKSSRFGCASSCHPLGPAGKHYRNLQPAAIHATYCYNYIISEIMFNSCIPVTTAAYHFLTRWLRQLTQQPIAGLINKCIKLL